MQAQTSKGSRHDARLRWSPKQARNPKMGRRFDMENKLEKLQLVRHDRQSGWQWMQSDQYKYYGANEGMGKLSRRVWRIRWLRTAGRVGVTAGQVEVVGSRMTWELVNGRTGRHEWMNSIYRNCDNLRVNKRWTFSHSFDGKYFVPQLFS